MSGTSHDLAAPPGDSPLRQALEQAGLRFTRQRAAVYDFVRSAASHPTADDVYAAVRRQVRSISLATVYKALDALVGARLINRIPTADGPCRYDCRGDAHYHFHCLSTHQIFDLPTPYDPGLVEKLDPHLVEALRERGFHVTGYRLELLGYSQPQR
jgi:Fe2+ or Zn2+ uptake regulation protein